MNPILSYAIGAGLLALAYGTYLTKWILKQPAGDGKMIGISLAIQEGANAYMARQNKMVAMIGGIIFVLLGAVLDWEIAAGFAVGAFCSGLAGFIGMSVSVRANVRTELTDFVDRLVRHGHLSQEERAPLLSAMRKFLEDKIRPTIESVPLFR